MLTRKPVTPPLPDWRADERVRRLDERDADLARQAEQAAAELDAAIAAREAAHAAHAAALATYLRGAVDERPADPVDDVPAAQARFDALARERVQLASFRPGIEAQAQADAHAAFLALLRPLVARLLEATDAAAAADAAVVDLWAAAGASGIALPAYAYEPLVGRDVPRIAVHPESNNLASWQLAAAAFVAPSQPRRSR